MQSTDKLFRLIKSLDKHEKGYFKKFAGAFSGGKDSNPLSLFDAIDKQDEYDEEALLRKFRKETFAKQLSVTKSYLYELILKTLRSYYANRSSTIQINDLVENAEILFARSLYDEAFDALQKARTLCDVHDNKVGLLDIMKRERGFLLLRASKEWNSTIAASLEESRSVSDLLAEQMEQYNVYYQLYYLWRHEGHIRTTEQAAQVEALMNSEPMKLDWQRFSFNGQQTYWTIHMIYHFLKNEDRAAYDCMKRALEMWEAHPDIRYSECIRYIAALNNFFSICMKLGLEDELESYIENLDTSFTDRHETAEATLFEMLSTFHLYIALTKLDYNKMGKIVSDVQAGIVKYSNRLSRIKIMLLRYNCMVTYILLDDYGAALDMVNELLNMKDVELRKDMQVGVRIYNLIIHYELNNLLLLDSAVRSARHYMQTREQYFELEKVFLRHFSHLITCSDRHERALVFTALKKEVEETAASNPLEANLLNTVDILIWTNAHRNNVSLGEWTKREQQAKAKQ